MEKIADNSGTDTLAGRMLKRLPVDTSKLQSQMKSGAQRLERRVLQTLKQRMDQLEPGPSAPASVSVLALSLPGNLHYGKPDAKKLAARMRELLDTSSEHSREDAQVEFFSWVVDNLVPDQARILSAMSDGSSYPLLNVLAGKKLGLSMEPVLECISSVGKNAGVLWPDTTHVYVQQLRNWGLVELGPEDNSREMHYQILETETLVRKTIKRLEGGGLRTQLIRRTLRISELGQELWDATRIGQD